MNEWGYLERERGTQEDAIKSILLVVIKTIY